MKLDKLRIRNFRCFKQLDIEFDENLTVLVAPNGFGKTAVLDAISIAFGTFIGEFDAGSPKHANAWDIHRFPVYQDNQDILSHEVPAPIISSEFASELSISVDARYQNQQVSWFRELRTKGRTTVKDARPVTEIGSKLQREIKKSKNPKLPLLVYYGTGRLWSHKKHTQKKKNYMEQSRTYGYTDCLAPDSTYHAFEDWFQRIITAEREYAAQAAKETFGAKAQHDLYFAHREAVANAVEEVMSRVGWHNLSCNPLEQQIVLSSSTSREMPVNSMSDGVRAMVGLAADMAFRCVKLNPVFKPEDLSLPNHGGACRTTEGIVLIDEVDMHLHPSWQQTVLSDLKKAFPKIQFIVTTHSPQVLSTIHAEKIRVLKVDDEGRGTAFSPPVDPYGKISRIALEDIMDVPAEPTVAGSENWEKYQELILNNLMRSEQAVDLREELEEMFGADDERFLVLDMMSRRQQAIRGNK